MIKSLQLILGMMVLITVGQAQSIDSLIVMAKENNPGLRALRMNYDAALLKADQVNDWPDPTVNLGLGLLPVETRLGAQRVKLGVRQMIPWPGILEAQSKTAKTKAEIVSNADEIKLIDIEYAITSSYYSLAFLEAQKRIINQRLVVLDAIEEMAKSAVRSGKGKLSNLLFVERKRELFNYDLEILEKRKEQPTIMINRWTGRALDTKIKIINNNKMVPDRIELESYATQGHPKFQMLENEILSSKSVIELNKYQEKPKIGVGLEYALIEQRDNIILDNNGRDVLMPVGSISIPIHKGRYKAVKQEQIVRQNAIHALQDETKDEFKAEIQMAFSKIEYAEEIISKYQSLKEITLETIKLMRTEYSSEGTKFEELLRLEMELIDFDQKIVEARYEIDLALATLNKFN